MLTTIFLKVHMSKTFENYIIYTLTKHWYGVFHDASTENSRGSLLVTAARWPVVSDQLNFEVSKLSQIYNWVVVWTYLDTFILRGPLILKMLISLVWTSLSDFLKMTLSILVPKFWDQMARPPSNGTSPVFFCAPVV